MGQRPLSVAQVADRLRSGSAASSAEACIAIHVLVSHCEFMARVGKPLRCSPLAEVAMGAGLIPLFVGLLAKGGYTAVWACAAIMLLCSSTAPGQLPPDVQGAFEDARAAFLASGGVEAAVELLALPLRHADLGALLSPRDAAGRAIGLLYNLDSEFARDHAFKVRCIDAGIVEPLIQHLGHGGAGLLTFDDCGAALLAAQLCLHHEESDDSARASPKEVGRAVPSVVNAVIAGGAAPVLVKRLKLAEG